MKTRNSRRVLTMLLAGTLMAMTPHWAAASTAPCTPIANTATLSYSVGGAPQAPISNAPGSATFNVGVKVIVSVANNDGNEVTVVPGTGKYALKFTVKNDGNAVQDYDLSALAAASGTASPFGGNNDSFNGTTLAIYPDVNGDDTFVWADDGAAPITKIDNVAADGGTKVVFIVYSPTDLAESNLETAVYYLKATSKWMNDTAITFADGTPSAAQAGGVCDGSISVAVVAGDGDGDGAGSNDGLRDGSHLNVGAYEVSTSALTINKTANTIWDPINYNSTPKAIPGALVRYVISISNAGGAPTATLTTITDTLVASLVMDPDLKTNNLATATPTFENAADNGFKALVTGGSRAGDAGGLVNGTPKYYTTTGSADGVDLSGQDITATLATILPADNGAVAPGDEYAAGELKGGETLTITFNAVIQ